MTMIYHITTEQAWQAAQKTGKYSAPSLESEGFIHCSTLEQILPVANSFYRGQQALVLLEIAPQALQAPLKWEAPVHPNPEAADAVDDAQQFPHVYGAINVDAVQRVIDFPAQADGTFSLPPALRG